jgi:hypothetical protein
MLRILAVAAFCFAQAACTQEASIENATNAQTSELSSCPHPVEPGPHFCQDGMIIVVEDERGCKDWACDRGDESAAKQGARPPSCPVPVYPGEQFCQDGTIVVAKDESGCSYYDCER